MPDMSVWPELLEQVNQHNGVYKIKMSTLRQMEGAQRMGPGVADAIENRLATLGLAHVPSDLNVTQEREVLLLKTGTEAMEVVRTVQSLLEGEGDVSDRTTSLLGRVNEVPDPAGVVSRSELRKPMQELLDTVTEVFSMTSRPMDEEEEVQL